jgi:hypothetical protein
MLDTGVGGDEEREDGGKREMCVIPRKGSSSMDGVLSFGGRGGATGKSDWDEMNDTWLGRIEYMGMWWGIARRELDLMEKRTSL